MKFKYLLLTITLMAAGMTRAVAEDARFNVGTYNIRLQTPVDDAKGNGWERRAPYVSQLVRFHGFDIFGTQEGFKNQLEDMKSMLPGYDYTGHGREDGKDEGEHSAIFYRTDMFDLTDHGDFWLSETPDKPGLGWDAACVRICSWGKFRHKTSGKEFLFFNLHMDHIGTTARVESAKLIKKKIEEFGADLPTFLTGDFNVDQFSPSYATIIEGDLLTDSHNRAEIVYELNGTFNNYKTNGFTTSRIDHIFVSPAVNVERYGILTDSYRTPEEDSAEMKTVDAPSEVKVHKYVARNPSDHYPVLTTVNF